MSIAREAIGGHHVPPLGESEIRPKVSVRLMDAQPIFDLFPKTNAEATMNKNAVNRLRALLA
jgi:hypothetical protein